MKKNKIAFIVNTISKNNDIWQCFFDSIENHTTPNLFNKKYVFLDDDLSKIPKQYQVCKYDPSLNKLKKNIASMFPKIIFYVATLIKTKLQILKKY